MRGRERELLYYLKDWKNIDFLRLKILALKFSRLNWIFSWLKFSRLNFLTIENLCLEIVAGQNSRLPENSLSQNLVIFMGWRIFCLRKNREKLREREFHKQPKVNDLAEKDLPHIEFYIFNLIQDKIV